MLLSERGNSKTFREAIGRKILPRGQLESFAKLLRENGKTLVTINGSFDCLHPGHLEILYQASLQADVFLVLLNTDASIKAYKSPKRPIQPLEVRMQHMAALEFVDYVSDFDEVNPIRVLNCLKPDVHANGSEYGENCIEADIVCRNGGRIHVIKLLEGYSTTNLIERIKRLCD